MCTYLWLPSSQGNKHIEDREGELIFIIIYFFILFKYYLSLRKYLFKMLPTCVAVTFLYSKHMT